MADDRAQFFALGPLEARRHGDPVDLGRPKQRALLALLLDAWPHPLPVDDLVDELWGSAPPGDPLRSIQVYVSALRRVLGPATLLTAGRTYRIDMDAEAFDVARFERAVAAVELARRAGDHVTVAETAAAALADWRGDAWADLRHMSRLEAAAARLHSQRLDLVAASASARLALGRHREVAVELEPVVREHPLREDLREQLMLALHRSGRQAEALATYDFGRLVKAEETGLDPGHALQELQARILADDPGLAAEDAELRARRHLPALPTRFFGRDREIAELVELLSRPGCRLVTLTGPGGIGKTRLAVEVAHRLTPSYPHGVWFVSLADLRDPDLVPGAIAGALGVEDVAGDVRAALEAHLAGRTLLLVADNFEHVDDAAPVLSGLLRAAEGLRVLVTSRAKLRLYGEHVRQVQPLESAAAVPLFCERALGVARWFDTAATSDVARICAALDHIPLALELVAARADEVSLPEMTAQLDRRLELADVGPRDRDLRQRSLRGAIRWSIDLLSPGQAELFARLGVFVGGFDRDAAAAVAGADAADLDALVRASLVGVDGERFRMLEVIREYALESLTPTAHLSCAATHAQWFADLAVASVDGGRGKDRRAWHARLHAERGNMRAALEWLAGHAAEESAAELLLRAAGALGIFWYRTGPTDNDVAWIERALALAPDADAELRGRAHYALAICRAEQGRAEEALAHGRRAYSCFESGGDPAWVARATNTLAGVLRDLGQAAAAVPMMEHSIRLRRCLAHPMLPPTLALANRAMAALDLGDLPTARRCLEECLTDEDETEVAMVRRLLAEVALDSGDPVEAGEHLAAAIPVLQRGEQHYRLIECLDTLAWLAVQRGEHELAATLIAAADRGLAEEGARMVPADAALRHRRVAATLAAMDPRQRTAAVARGAELGVDEAVGLAVARLRLGARAPAPASGGSGTSSAV